MEVQIVCLSKRILTVTVKSLNDQRQKVESENYLMWNLEGKVLDFLTKAKIDLEKYWFQKIYEKTGDQIWHEEIERNLEGEIPSSFSEAVWNARRLGRSSDDSCESAFVDLPEDDQKKKLLLDYANIALTRMQQNIPVWNSLNQ